MSETENRLLALIDRYMLGPAQPAWSYTRAYFHWKKTRGVRDLFKKEIRKRPAPLKVLDVGCGFGQYVFILNQEFAQDKDLEFHGVDIDPLNVYYCGLRKEKYRAANLSFSQGNAEALNIAANSFDIIVSTELLEHLQEPGRALAEFCRVLRPDGLLIITTPNGSNLMTKALNTLKRVSWGKAAQKESADSAGLAREGTRQSGYGHISVKGLREWLRILSESGFKTERIKRGSLLLGTSRQDARRVVGSLLILAEVILDNLPFLRNLSEDVIISARKRNCSSLQGGDDGCESG